MTMLDADNPVLNTKILTQILEYIPHSECPKYRLVCRKWNEVCCCLLQTTKSSVVTFSTVTDLVNYLEHFNRNSTLPKNFPYPHSQFHLSKIRLHLIFDNYTLRKFFKIFGPQLNHLQLDFIGQSFRLKFLRVSIWNSLEHSRLRTLSLYFKDFHHLWPWALAADQPLCQLRSVKSLSIRGIGSDEVLLKPFISKIVECLPNLTSIEMGHQSGKILCDLMFGPQPGILKYIEDLNFHCLYCPQVSNIVAEKIRLKKLQAVFHENISTKECHSLLNSVSSTLVTSSLESSHIVFPAPSQRFTQLTTLELKQFVCNQDDVVQSNDCLQSITLELCIGLNSHLLRRFAVVAPNLKRLDIPLPMFRCEEDLFQTICEEMGNLEELFLADDYITDQSITGIPNSTCKKLLEDMKYGKRLSRKDSLNLESLRQGRKWIGCLKKLRVLDIKTIDVSDCGVVYGILYCESLQRLTVHSPYWLTNLTLRAISEKFHRQLVLLDLLCSNQITESAIEDLREKMHGRKCVITENRFSSSDSP